MRKILEGAGWQLVRVNGSHRVFKKAGAVDVVLPVHSGKVKAFYARQVRQVTGHQSG